MSTCLQGDAGLCRALGLAQKRILFCSYTTGQYIYGTKNGPEFREAPRAADVNMTMWRRPCIRGVAWVRCPLPLAWLL